MESGSLWHGADVSGQGSVAVSCLGLLERVAMHTWALGGWGPRRVCGASWYASPAARITIPEIVWRDESTLRKLLETGEVAHEIWE